jgi:hypothetical protein
MRLSPSGVQDAAEWERERTMTEREWEIQNTINWFTLTLRGVAQLTIIISSLATWAAHRFDEACDRPLSTFFLVNGVALAASLPFTCSFVACFNHYADTEVRANQRMTRIGVDHVPEPPPAVPVLACLFSVYLCGGLFVVVWNVLGIVWTQSAEACGTIQASAQQYFEGLLVGMIVFCFCTSCFAPVAARSWIEARAWRLNNPAEPQQAPAEPQRLI